MKLTMLGNKVLIEQDKCEDKTKSGIIIPATAKEAPNIGRIIQLGTDNTENLNIGDKVIYGKHAGTEIKLEDKTYVYVEQCDILAKIE